MPEGHTIHRLAEDYPARSVAAASRVTSPQGKFTDAAALLDGSVLTAAEAHGKHLFLGFARRPSWVHIHLGLFGKVGFGDGPAPPPTDTVRLRLHERHRVRRPARPHDLRPDHGPREAAIHDRLGPDPLRPDDDPRRAYRRISRSRTTIAALLMDQKVIAGVGNVYRAEVLFRHGIDPYRAGKDLTRAGVGRDLGRPRRADARGRPQQPHRHRPPRAHPRGDGPPAARGRPRRRGLRLPQGRTCPATSVAARSAPPISPPATSSGARPASASGRPADRRPGL